MPVNTTFRHPLFAQIIKYSNIRYGRNISGTDCIPEKNERLVLAGCITANQYRSNLFMDRHFQWFRIISGNPRQFNYRDESANCAYLHS